MHRIPKIYLLATLFPLTMFTQFFEFVWPQKKETGRESEREWLKERDIEMEKREGKLLITQQLDGSSIKCFSGNVALSFNAMGKHTEWRWNEVLHRMIICGSILGKKRSLTSIPLIAKRHNALTYDALANIRRIQIFVKSCYYFFYFARRTWFREIV